MTLLKTFAASTTLLVLALPLFLLPPSVEALPRKNTTATTTTMTAAAAAAVASKGPAASAKTIASFLDRPAVVQYWGQNSAGATGSGQQEPLASYCDDITDALIIAFVNQFNIGGKPGLSLSCGADCLSVGTDIKTCQASGHTILLSLGGAVGAYGFTDDTQATEFARTLWDTFGNGKGGSDRPFGDAVVDGFDLDIEGGTSTGYVQLIAELRSLFKSDSGKNYYLTAAPQCPFPDAYMGTDLVSAMDAVFVQFYNNPCSISGAFNFEEWDAWASSAGVKVLIGIPGSPSAAGSGYASIDMLSSAIAKVSSLSSYGGVMVWDASQSYGNTNPSPNFATALGILVHEGSSSSSSSSSVAKSGALSSGVGKGIQSHKVTDTDIGATATKTTTGYYDPYTTSILAPTTTTATHTTGYYDPYTTSILAPTTATEATIALVVPTTTNKIYGQLAVKNKAGAHHCNKMKAKKAGDSNKARSL